MATTVEIADSIVGIKTRLEEVFTRHGWSKTAPIVQFLGGYAPQVSVEFITKYIVSVADRIRPLKKPDFERNGLGAFLASLPAQAEAITFDNFQQDPDAVLGRAMMFLQAVATRLPHEPLPKPEVDWDRIKDKELLPKDLARRLRSVEAKLKDLEPRTAAVSDKINEIEAAHAAAEQLPTDLEELTAQREALNSTVAEASKLAAQIQTGSEQAEAGLGNIEEARARADQLIKRSEEALRGATGVGLASAFEKRKQNLTWAGIAWTFSLALALGAILWIGAERVETLKDVLISDRSATVIWVNALLAILGVGAPVWFAWLATKHIGTNFRLAEDYAFKASVSKAYEGYRAEAVSIDPALQARLFSSALTRLEEAPIRLLEGEVHGSPLQELLSNKAVRRALENVPGITDKVLALLPSKNGAAVAASSAAAAATIAALAGSEPNAEVGPNGATS